VIWHELRQSAAQESPPYGQGARSAFTNEEGMASNFWSIAQVISQVLWGIDPQSILPNPFAFAFKESSKVFKMQIKIA
jgi:hypothetical protein